ncbi:MAG TPA: FAD-dependent oxidoreductase, partial [Methylophilaceae bacterium]|nr:FAD-dependent oxidoreductase [Methylophilaceae bacterium]
MPLEFDVLIIGSGLSGLTLALQIANTKKVCIVSKRTIHDSASDWAQGGIATVLNSDDSIDEHIHDTLQAGAGLCDAVITRLVTENGRQAIDWLIDLGVEFTREENTETGYHLTREGGHSRRRIIHV